MSRFSRVLTGLVAVACLVGPAAAATNVCGMITTNTTWNLAGSPYIVTCDVTILSGATLTIDPGVAVKLMPGTAIEVQTGTLSAIGTTGTGVIVFESGDLTNRTMAIRHRPPLGGVANFQYCEFRNLTTAIDIQCCWGPNANIGSVDQCNFHDNDYCLTGYNGYVLPITNSAFTANTVVANQADKQFTNCNFSSNGTVLQGTERIGVANSFFLGNVIGAWGFRGTIRDSIFMANGTAIDNMQEGFTLSRNVIINNAVGMKLSSANGFVSPMDCNDIYNSDMWDVEVTTNFSVNLPNIWWGTTVPGLIDAKIKDNADNNALGVLNYAGLLPSNHASQPSCACTAPSFTLHPAGANRYQGQSVTFTTAASFVGTPTYQWYRNGNPITNGGRFSGATTDTLTVNPIARPSSDPAWTDSGSYTCTATNLCGTATSNPAYLNVTWCPADIGDSGAVSVQDIYDFMSLWSSGCP